MVREITGQKVIIQKVLNLSIMFSISYEKKLKLVNVYRKGMSHYLAYFFISIFTALFFANNFQNYLKNFSRVFNSRSL